MALDMRPIKMMSDRGTECTMPAHMGPALLDRGYTMLAGPVAQSGEIAEIWNPGADESDGTGMSTGNPFA